MSEVDVVIVAFGSATGLLNGSISSASAEAVVRKIYVVDNSGDLALDPPRSDGRVRVLRPEHNLGFGAGQNLGIAQCTAPFVLMLNPDASLVPGALADGVECLNSDPTIAAVQGICRDPEGAPDRSQGSALGPLHLFARALGLRRLLRVPAGRAIAASMRWSGDHVRRAPVQRTDVEWLAATALLVRRAAFQRVGGFDEKFFLYGEDLDLARRFRDAEYRLVALPIEWSTHRQGSTFGSPDSREVEWWRGTLLYAAKWWSNPAWWAAQAAALLRALTMQSPGTHFLSRVQPGMKEARARRREPPPVGIE